MRLISRWQNSAGERVRIALRLKCVDYTYIPISSLECDQFAELNARLLGKRQSEMGQDRVPDCWTIGVRRCSP